MLRHERIVVANSVGIDANGWAIIHSPSRWTNSSKEKDVFTYYPWELAYTSALLKRETDQYVKFIDGCLEKLTVEAYLELILAEKPTFLIMEPSTRTWRDDARLMRLVKDACGARLIVVGQHATAFPQEVSRIADYVVLGEYEYTVLDIVTGKQRRDILGLYPNQRRPLLDIKALPWPEDEDVSRLQYGIPGEPSSEYLEIQAYATRGCPMNCSFCVCRHLYYGQPNWRVRSTSDIVRELAYLKLKYPALEGIFFDEECHNIGRQFVIDLSREIIQRKLNTLHIEAMCSYYTLDEEVMEAMKAAGYYLLRIGIETAGEGAARGINLGAKFNLNKLRQTLRSAKKIGLKMYGTFTFGAPGSSEKDDQATLDFMEEIISEGLLWRFQTSICTPQPGTPFYSWAQAKGLISTYASEDYDGGNRVVLEYPDYSSEKIMRMYLKAQRFFDIALHHRFMNGIEESKKTLQSMHLTKILVLRTSRMPQVQTALTVLREAFPHAIIDIIGQPDVHDGVIEWQQTELVNTIYWYDTGFFARERLDATMVNTIKNAHYECAFIFYSNRHGRGYENVEECLTALALPQWMAFDSDGRLREQNEIEERRTTERVLCT